MRSIFVLVTIAVMCVASAAAGGPYIYNGYKDAAPAYPRGELYDRYYFNLKEVLPCVTTGNVFKNATNGGFETHNQYRGAIGCLTPQGAPYYFLFPLHVEDAKALNDECDTKPKSQWTHFKSIIPTNQEHINLVLMPTKEVSSTAEGESLKSGGPSAPYKLKCLLRQIAAAHSDVKAFTGVRSILDTTDLASPSPLSGVSPYTTHRSWFPSGTGLSWMPHHITGMVFNATMASSEEVKRIQQEAHYNHHRYKQKESRFVSPRFVSETNMAMKQLKEELPEPQDSCLTIPVPTCLPVGGMSVWATTQNNIPSWQNGTDAVEKKLTAPNSIAVMVSSTSTAFFHDVVPAADAAVSGTVSLMSVVNAVSTSYLAKLRDMGTAAPQLYFFFFVGEEYGLGGSGRFAKEVVEFECQAYPTKNTTQYGCLFPYYRYTNFTSVNLTQFEHFIAIDQVGIGGELFYHVDNAIYTASPAQRRAAQAFEAADVKRSSVGQVPPGSLYSMMGAFNETFRNAKSFTALTAYNAEFKNKNYQSSSDVPELVNVTNVVRSAQVIAEVVTSLLNDNLDADDKLPPAVVDVDFTTDDLWHCMAVDQKCSYFQERFGFQPATSEPSYYPSVFAFYQQISQTQQFLFYYAADQLKDISGPYNDTSCPCGTWYDICVSGKCYPLQSFLHHSFSPALEYVNKAPIYFNQSDTQLGSGFEIWVESFWDPTIGARLTATESTTNNGLILMCGLFVMVLSVVALALLKRVVAPKLKQL